MTTPLALFLGGFAAGTFGLMLLGNGWWFIGGPLLVGSAVLVVLALRARRNELGDEAIRAAEEQAPGDDAPQRDGR